MLFGSCTDVANWSKKVTSRCVGDSVCASKLENVGACEVLEGREHPQVPSQGSCRARLDCEGNNMWMMALNVGNTGGEMRYVSMDGTTTQNNVSGLAKSQHHRRFLQRRSH